MSDDCLTFLTYQTRYSQDGDYEEHCILVCCAESIGRNLSIFRRNILPPFSWSKSKPCKQQESKRKVPLGLHNVTSQNFPSIQEVPSSTYLQSSSYLEWRWFCFPQSFQRIPSCSYTGYYSVFPNHFCLAVPRIGRSAALEVNFRRL